LIDPIPPPPDREVLARHSIPEGDLIPDLDRSHGTWLVDARSGAEHLDFFTYFATLPLGHNHPALSGVEFRAWLGRCAVDKPSLSDMRPDEVACFVEAFERVALPKDLPHLFFIEGGALAVENALKTAFDWKVRQNIDAGLGERGGQVVHFRQAFHGRSGYALSLTNTADLRKTDYFPMFDWPRIDNPACAFPLEGENLERTRVAEQAALDQIDRVLDERGPDVAALIIEPIQGEGGDNHFRGEFLRALRRVCYEHDIFYVLDEVQTGLGTTGAMWCYQHFGFTPDAVAFGKKAQVCGVMVSRRVDEVKENVFRVPSRINSTWGGNLVDMARATRILKVIESEDLVSNAAERGRQILERLGEVAAEVGGERVTNVRGRGLLAAFDVPSTKERDELRRRLREEGKMLVLGCGERSIRFRPPLTVSAEEVDEAADRLLRVLKS